MFSEPWAHQGILNTKLVKPVKFAFVGQVVSKWHLRPMPSYGTNVMLKTDELMQYKLKDIAEQGSIELGCGLPETTIISIKIKKPGFNIREQCYTSVSVTCNGAFVNKKGDMVLSFVLNDFQAANPPKKPKLVDGQSTLFQFLT